MSQLASDREGRFRVVGGNQGRALIRREERVVEVDFEGRGRTTEERRRGQLRRHVGVDGEHATVDLGRIVDVEVDRAKGRPALLRNLEVVVRVVVEGGVRRVLTETAARGQLAIGREVAARETARRRADRGASGTGVARTELTVGTKDIRRVGVPVTGVAVTVGGEQVVVRVSTVTLQHFIALGVTEREDRRTAIIGELGTGRERGAHHATIAFAVLRGVIVSLQAFEILLGDEVHDARHGIRSVHRRSATGDDVDALDDRARDQVDVDSTARAERRQTLAIHQHQGAVRAETTQVDRGGARVAVVDVLGRARQELRQLTQLGFEVDDVQLFELFGRHRRDGAI